MSSLSNFQYVTLVPSGGTPVRLANQVGAPIPTTGNGALVFANGPTLNNPTLDGTTWIGPQVIEGDFEVEDDFIVGGASTFTGLVTFNGGIDLGEGEITTTAVNIRGSSFGATKIVAAAEAGGTLTLPNATDTIVARATADTLTNKSIAGNTNTLTLIPVSALNGGTGASATTFWRGDGTWATPAGAAVSLGVGSTVITGGTSGRVLYDNAGVLGEYTATAALSALGVPVFSVLNYGADPTGIGTSDAAYDLALAAIQAAGEGTLIFPPGTYRFTSGHEMVAHMSIVLDHATLDFSGRTSGGYCLRALGTLGTATNLTTQAIRGEAALVVADTSDIDDNDWIFLNSTMRCLTADTSDEWRLGDTTASAVSTYFAEPIRVQTVDSATDLTLESEIIFPTYALNPTNGVSDEGSWNALTNSPALASGVGTEGDYYTVSVAGTTNLDGITTWDVGNVALFTGGVWTRINGTARKVSTVQKINFIEGLSVRGTGTIIAGGTTIFRLLLCKDFVFAGAGIKFEMSQQPSPCIRLERCLRANIVGNAEHSGLPGYAPFLADHSDYNSWLDVGSWWSTWTTYDVGGSQGLDVTYTSEGNPSIQPLIINSSHIDSAFDGMTFHQGCYGGTVVNFRAVRPAEAGISNRSRFVTIINPQLVGPNVDNGKGGIDATGWATDGSVVGGRIEGFPYGYHDTRDGQVDVAPPYRNMSITGTAFVRTSRAVYLEAPPAGGETDEPSGWTISNITADYTEDFVVMIDDYVNYVNVDGVTSGVMSGANSEVVFCSGDSVAHTISNIRGGLESDTTLVQTNTITDTTTFPAATWPTNRIRVALDTLAVTGTGIRANLDTGYYRTFNVDTTLNQFDAFTTVRGTSASARTLTVPEEITGVSFPTGTWINVIVSGAGAVTVAAENGNVTINGASSLVLPQYTQGVLYQYANNTWMFFNPAVRGATNTFTAAQVISVTDNTNPALRVTQSGTGLVARFEDDTNPDSTPTVITNAGTVVIGNEAAQTIGGGSTNRFQMVGTSTATSTAALGSWSTSQAAGVVLARSRGTAGANTVVNSGDSLGVLGWWGADGASATSMVQGAGIRAEVDGTPGSNDMPGRIIFATTLDGAASVTDRWQIDNAGMLRALSGSFSLGVPVTKTADFTVATSENWLINNKAGSACVVTLPSAASFPGREIKITNYQAQTVDSVASNVVPLGGGAAGTAILSAAAGRWCTLVSDGTNWVIMQGVI